MAPPLPLLAALLLLLCCLPPPPAHALPLYRAPPSPRASLRPRERSRGLLRSGGGGPFEPPRHRSGVARWTGGLSEAGGPAAAPQGAATGAGAGSVPEATITMSSSRPLQRESKHSGLRILLLTVWRSQVPADPSALFLPALHSKRCYAERHGYSFILDESPPAHARRPHWDRIPAIQKYLPFYDWVYYTDADVIITNSTLPLETFVQSDLVTEDTSLILTDGDHVNSGGFLIRRRAWSFRFLFHWWEYGKLPYQEFVDQGALTFLVLDVIGGEVGERGGGRYNGECGWSDHPDIPARYDDNPGRRSLMCYRSTLREGLSLPIGTRIFKHLMMWPCNHPSAARGFNFYAVYCDFRSRCQCYHRGDLMAHGKDLGEFNIGFTNTSCPIQEEWRLMEVGVRPFLPGRAPPWLLPMLVRNIEGKGERVTYSYLARGQPYLFVARPMQDQMVDLKRSIYMNNRTFTIDNMDHKLQVLRTWTLKRPQDRRPSGIRRSFYRRGKVGVVSNPG